MSCPATGLKDFPVQTTVTVTDTLNQSILEEPSLEVQWAKRGTVPSFQQNFLNEGIYGSAEQTTSLRLQGNTYTLQFVKLAEPQHRGFLSVDLKPLCIGELVLGFKSAAALTEKYVFVCIPVVNKPTQSPSPYLEAIRQDRLPGRPIGLDDLLPFFKDYTSYTTCLRQVTSGNSTAVQARVLVFRAGLTYPKANFEEIVRKIKLPAPAGGTVSSSTPPPLGTLPEGLIAKTETTLVLISSEIDYRNYFRSSTLVQGSSREGGRRVDSTNAYKCVPLKPDSDVKNNRIVIDTDKGVPLSQILDEKRADLEGGVAQITPGNVERIIAIVLGTAAGLFILSILAYIFTRVTTDDPSDTFPWLQRQTMNLLPMVFVSMVVGIIGFLIGFFTSTQ